MKHTRLLLIWIITLSACAIPVDAPPDPTPFEPLPSQTSQPTQMPLPATPIPILPLEIYMDEIPALLTRLPASVGTTTNLCQNPNGLKLLLDFQTAIQTRNGEQLAALIHPKNGLGVQFIRNGSVVTYFENARYIFETTYQAQWGSAPGSGEPVMGAFHEIALPSLDHVLSSNPLITCNQLKTGGATYTPEFPYPQTEYYSLYFPGTDLYSQMDWQTWAIGVANHEGRQTLTALIRFAWEP